MHGFNAPHGKFEEIQFGNKTLDYNPENPQEHLLFEGVTVEQ